MPHIDSEAHFGTPVPTAIAPRAPETGRAQPQRTIRALGRAIPEECYENPTTKGLLYLGRDLALFVASIALLLIAQSWWTVLAGWALSSLTIAGLFVIGHDAAHGALFKSPRLNYLAGQLAMLPSLHPLSVWAYGHNRVHHAFPGCRDLDFVWHPVTREDFQRMSRWQRLRHRLDWSFFGAGTYYVREIWWNRLVCMPPPPQMRDAFRRDRAAVIAYLAILSALASAVGWAQSETFAGAAWAWVRVVLVPWAIWNVMIGFTIYVQHISPTMPWRNRRRWRKYAGQVETTSNLRIPPVLNFFWHNIFVHIPHHVDPRIPFYHLPAAARALSREDPAVKESRPYHFREYVWTVRRCKLYDFEREEWSGYDDAPAG